MTKKINPKEVAEIVSEKYLDKGYKLDFSLRSLEVEIDKILENETSKDVVDSWELESELTAYFGESLCRIFKTVWKGRYYLDNSGMNFYTCKIAKNGFEFGPSHFISYYLSNGKKNEGTFKDFLDSGLIKKIK